MFKNIGGKIKALAKVICWIGIISSVIWGGILCGGVAIAGILVAVLGSLGSWISSFFIYGFGQLIENSDILVIQCNNIAKEANNTKNDPTDNMQA